MRKGTLDTSVNSPVTIVPGIGKAIGERLKRKGISTAIALYGCYRTDKKGFKELIEDNGGKTIHQNDAFRAMKDYDERQY